MSEQNPQEKSIRDKVRGAPVRLAAGVFKDPGFRREMNNWMIGTHILWGFTLAVTFIGLNYTLIWLNPPPWVISVTFTPLGVGYIVWQWWKFRPENAKSDASENPDDRTA